MKKIPKVGERWRINDAGNPHFVTILKVDGDLVVFECPIEGIFTTQSLTMATFLRDFSFYEEDNEPSQQTTGNERRKALLAEVEQCVCKDRQKTHGDPEDNFADIAELWSVYKDRPFTSHDVAVMMVLVKVARLKTSPKYKDNWIDIAGYAVCGGSLAKSPQSN